MARVDAKLLQIMPKLQIFLDKGKVTFNYNTKRKRFRLLNFLRAAILDFMTSRRCLYCWKAKVLLFETIGQRSDVMKSKMAARRKFKRRNLCSFSHTCFAYRVFSDSNSCFFCFSPSLAGRITDYFPFTYFLHF